MVRLRLPWARRRKKSAGFHAGSFIVGIITALGVYAIYQIVMYFNSRSLAKIGADRVWKVDYTEIRKTKLIGKGKFGKVYKATWREKMVAVKVLNETRKLGKETLIEFVREVQIMSDLRHPNVLLFMGACVEPPNLAIVTAFMVKGSLWDLVHMAKPDDYFNDWNNRVNILINIALGMNYLHGFNPMIIHRDLKTPNVLVDENFSVCVSDFGLTHIKDAISDPRSLVIRCGMPPSCTNRMERRTKRLTFTVLASFYGKQSRWKFHSWACHSLVCRCKFLSQACDRSSPQICQRI